LSNPVPWQNWMAAYLGYTLRMRTLFHGWPIMVNDTHTIRRSLLNFVDIGALIAEIWRHPFLKMAATTAKYYFRFRICWCHCLQKVKVYQETKFRRHISIYGCDITTSGFEKQTSAILEFYFWFWSRPFRRNRRVFYFSLPYFVKIGALIAKIWRHIHFSRWRPQSLNTTSGFVFVDVTASRRTESVSKPNFVDISQLTAEI